MKNKTKQMQLAKRTESKDAPKNIKTKEDAHKTKSNKTNKQVQLIAMETNWV